MFLAGDRLEAFFVCAQTGHFGKAAARLGVTQSALSQRIGNLEAQLQKTLIIRDTKKARLTPEGEQLLQYCLSIRDVGQEFPDLFPNSETKSERGSLRLAGYSSITRSVLLPALKDVLLENPEVHFDLSSREFRELPPMLRRGEVDFIVTAVQQENPRWERVSLGTERYVWVQPTRAKRGSRVLDHDPEDLTSEPILSKHTPRPPRDFVDDIYGIMDAVKAGLGSALIPKHLAQSFEDSNRFQVTATRILHRVELYYWRRPYYSDFHNQVIGQLRAHSRATLA